MERVSHPLGGPCMRRTERRRSAVSRFKRTKKEPVLKDGFNHFCGRLRHGRSELASEPRVGRAECDVERQSAEALARLIVKKKEKYSILFYWKYECFSGVDCGCSCEATGVICIRIYVGCGFHRLRLLFGCF